MGSSAAVLIVRPTDPAGSDFSEVLIARGTVLVPRARHLGRNVHRPPHEGAVLVRDEVCSTRLGRRQSAST